MSSPRFRSRLSSHDYSLLERIKLWSIWCLRRWILFIIQKCQGRIKSLDLQITLFSPDKAKKTVIRKKIIWSVQGEEADAGILLHKTANNFLQGVWFPSLPQWWFPAPNPSRGQGPPQLGAGAHQPFLSVLNVELLPPSCILLWLLQKTNQSQRFPDSQSSSLSSPTRMETVSA